MKVSIKMPCFPCQAYVTCAGGLVIYNTFEVVEGSLVTKTCGLNLPLKHADIVT